MFTFTFHHMKLLKTNHKMHLIIIYIYIYITIQYLKKITVQESHIFISYKWQEYLHNFASFVNKFHQREKFVNQRSSFTEDLLIKKSSYGNKLK